MTRKVNYYLFLKVIFAICIIASGALAINLWFYYQPSSAELSFSRWLQLGRADWLTTLMKLVSDSYVALSLIVGGVCLWSLATRRYATSTLLALSLASLLLIDPVKSLFQRPRPIAEVPIIEYIAGTSFPSGHAYTATILAGVLCLAYIIGWGGKRVVVTAIMAGAYILLVSWSRVYLQVHYPFDVLGGVLFGLLTLLLLSFIYRGLRRLKLSR